MVRFKSAISVAGKDALSEQPGALADDPFSGRHPTSHERLTGLHWDASYHEGPAPWDIGRPQPAIVRLASEGGFAGPVLDAGCGTGENAFVASLGVSVLGVDVAETALEIARAKAADRGVEIEFAADRRVCSWNVWSTGSRRCSTADCSTPSTPTNDRGYAASLASVTEQDGTLYVLCFSDDGPDTARTPSVRKS